MDEGRKIISVRSQAAWPASRQQEQGYRSQGGQCIRVFVLSGDRGKTNRDNVDQKQSEQSPRIRNRKMADRRRRTRFKLGLAVECRFAYCNLDRTFLGEVVNISSKGLLIRGTATALSTGQRVTACIDWPASLDNRVGLQLVAAGRVVRTTHDCTAIGIKTYEFRTRAARNTV